MKRLLFVDDNYHLLTGLKRGLRPLRRQWDMHFVTNASAALEYMQTTEVNVVITDYRMPGMSGFDLLSELQKKHPSTIRIILTGQPDRETYIESINLCHYFLWKPLDIEKLKPLLDRINNLDNLLTSHELTRKLNAITTLPTRPQIYHKLTRALNDPEEDLNEITLLVSNDVSLTMQILKMVNSSFFGLIRKIQTLDEAINYLGLNTIRSMILAQNIFCINTSSRHEEELYQLCQHSCATALLAEALVNNRDDRFLKVQTSFAGILHDIGKLIIIYYLPETHSKIKTMVNTSNISCIEAERRLLGYTHADLGAYIAQLWGLPYPLVEAVYLHLTKDINTVYGLSDMAAALWHANRICYGDTSASENQYHILKNKPELRSLLNTLVSERV